MTYCIKWSLVILQTVHPFKNESPSVQGNQIESVCGTKLPSNQLVAKVTGKMQPMELILYCESECTRTGFISLL